MVGLGQPMLDAVRIEGLFPGQHMLVDAVDQRAVEVEQKGRFVTHGKLPDG